MSSILVEMERKRRFQQIFLHLQEAMELLHVKEFGVDEGCRGEGIGRELIEALKKIAKEKGFKTIDLNVWEFNQGAIAFYDRVGFSTYRRHVELDVD